MKAVILAGGLGTRLSEETAVKPKPMVEIGGQPILWHILKIYSASGINDFIICCGYRGELIKHYFVDYRMQMADITVDLATNNVEFHTNGCEPWRITLVDTGLQSMTGGRLKRVRDYVGDETFCMTYGDGVADVNVADVIQFHKREKVLATMLGVQPPGRFGTFSLKESETVVSSFKEKPRGDGAWVNGGFFVLEPEVFEYIDDDATVWESQPMERLARDGQLVAYRHTGFWQPMDTLRDKVSLDELWSSGHAPWKSWE